MKRFILPENSKSNIVAGHRFNNDGELLVNDEDGRRLEKTLVRFYGCTVENVESTTDDENGSDDSSLSVDLTKGGSTVSDEDS